jgi:hypothetical protein
LATVNPAKPPMMMQAALRMVPIILERKGDMPLESGGVCHQPTPHGNAQLKNRIAIQVTNRHFVGPWFGA